MIYHFKHKNFGIILSSVTLTVLIFFQTLDHLQQVLDAPTGCSHVMKNVLVTHQEPAAETRHKHKHFQCFVVICLQSTV